MLKYVGERDEDAARRRAEEEEEPEGLRKASITPSEYDREMAKIKWYHKIILDRISKILIVLLVIAILVPAIMYEIFLFASVEQPPADGFSLGTCITQRINRLPCGPKTATTEARCGRECCFDRERHLCFHRNPSRYSYINDKTMWNFASVLHPRIHKLIPYHSAPSIEKLGLKLDERTRTHLSINFYDRSRHQKGAGKQLLSKEYDYEVLVPETSLRVFSGQRTLLDSSNGPLIAADGIWEWTFSMGTDLFGLGEIPLKGEFTTILYRNQDNPDVIPLIFGRINGLFHGVYIETDAPLDITVLQNQRVVVRGLIQEEIKVHVFTGPTPTNVANDLMYYTRKIPPPPYWLLGTHFCSETESNNAASVALVNDILSDAQTYNMPLDVHCGASAIRAEGLEETTLNALHTAFDEIKAAGIRLALHISPHIYYSSEEDMEKFGNVTSFFIGDPSGKPIPYIGNISGESVAYPDYRNPLIGEIIKQTWNLERQAALYVLENTWPLDETEKGDLHDYAKYFPYFNEYFVEAFAKAPAWNATYDSYQRHPYSNIHNTYGDHFSDIMRDYVINDTNALVSSSSVSYKTSDIVNRQSVPTLWFNLRSELLRLALGSVSGSPLWSIPVCGDGDNFNPDTQMELCMKWYYLSIYFPLFKLHSYGARRDPFVFDGTTRTTLIDAISRRYRLLPYFYSVLQEGPLIRPMFYQYPREEHLHDINTQFNIGDSLLIIPDLLPMLKLVNIFLPRGRWYEFWDGALVEPVRVPFTMASATHDIATLIKAGTVLPMQQEVKRTAEKTKLQASYTIVIALNFTDPADTKTGYAEGKLFISNHTTWHFTATSEVLNVRIEGSSDTFCDPPQEPLEPPELLKTAESLEPQEDQETTRISSGVIGSVKVYGLVERFNYDHHYFKSLDFDMCQEDVLNNGRAEITF